MYDGRLESALLYLQFKDDEHGDYPDMHEVKACLMSRNVLENDWIVGMLDFVELDVTRILRYAIAETPFLVRALKTGMVNGSLYSNRDCACLIGTIANARNVNYMCLEGITPSYYSAAELWFSLISIHDTPENSPIVALTVKWVEEFQKQVAKL